MLNLTLHSSLAFSDENSLAHGLSLRGNRKEQIQAVIDNNQSDSTWNNFSYCVSVFTASHRIVNELLEAKKGNLDYRKAAESHDDHNSPVLLLSPCKTPLTTTVAKFLDTSVCEGSWCLDPSLSPFLVKFTQILELILLDNPHKAAVLSVSCASFSSTLSPSTQLSVNMLGYSTLWTASLVMNVCGLPSLWRVSMIVFWTTVRSAVFPVIV